MVNIDELISFDSARRKVNGYLTMYVSMALIGENPILVTNVQEPYWRVSLNMCWPGLKETLTLGQIDVNAKTCAIVPLNDKEIRDIQDDLNDIIVRLDEAKI